MKRHSNLKINNRHTIAYLLFYSYICNMKNMTNISSSEKKRSKGDRLNWTPLRDVKPVKLKECSTSSRKLSKRDLSKINRNVTTLLIP